MMKIKLSNGYLLVEEKDIGGDYPGVWISYDVNGDPDEAILCACVEEDVYDNRILVETYCSEGDSPICIYDYFNGERID